MNDDPRPTDSVVRSERVGRGTAFALLAVPAGALVSGVSWHLGLVSCVAGLVVGVLAVALYAHGSGGRLRRGIPLVGLVTLLGLAASLLTGVVLDLSDAYSRLDAAMASVYGGRWSFVADNLFYAGLLEQYPRTTVLLAVLGAVGAAGTALLVARRSRAGDSQRASR